MTHKGKNALIGEIKSLIIKSVNIDGIHPEDIPDDGQLIGGESVLGLDSIDALEIVVAIQNRFHVRIDNQNLARNVLSSINAIADFVIRESPEYAGR